MMVQEYYLLMSEDNQLNARPGQLVYISHDSDTISGFISEVDHNSNRMRLTMFEAIEHRNDMLDVVEELSMEEVRLRLAQSLKENPDLIALWDEIIQQSTTDEE